MKEHLYLRSQKARKQHIVRYSECYKEIIYISRVCKTQLYPYCHTFLWNLSCSHPQNTTLIQINFSIDHWERDNSAWSSSAHKMRCLREPAVWNTKEVAQKLKGLSIFFFHFFFLFLIDGISLLLKGITARMSHWQKEGMAKWRNGPSFPAEHCRLD